MKRITSFALVLTLLALLGAGCARNGNGEPWQLREKEDYNLFINYVDGYELRLEQGYQVDMSMAEVVTVLEKEDTRIEIYRQALGDISAETYLGYSNRFLDNTIDHVVDLEQTITAAGSTVHLTGWHREALPGIPGDRNYYLEMDVVREDAVYTFLIKSPSPITEPEGFTGLLEHLKFFKPSATAPVWSSQAVDVETRGWNPETAAYYTETFGPEAGLTWGIFHNDASFGYFDELNEIERYIQHEFAISLSYRGLTTYATGILGSVLETSWREGKVVELTIQTDPMEDGSNMVYDVLQGAYDDILNDYARIIHAFGHPVLFRPFNEMNGDWCVYSSYFTAKDTQVYTALYRYVHDLFAARQVDNVIWVWNPNEGSFPNFNWNHTLMYYPGDAYVDVVGLTAYNTGTYYASVGESWKTFTELYETLYSRYCQWFAQPLMITEFSCAVQGGDKAAWVADMFQQIENYPRIHAAVWWNGADYDPETKGVSRNYRINEPQEVLDVFRENMP